MGRSTRLKLASWWLAPVALILFSVHMAQGQTPDVDDKQALIPLDYHFPTNGQRIRAGLRDTFGPRALLVSALVAGTHHLANDPPEWRQGTEGYGRRLASRVGRLAIQNSMELGLGVALQQDLRYRRCDCDGFLRRTGHALISNFTAHTRDGRRTFTIAKVASRYAGAMISTAWYPDRYTAGGDGVRLGTLSIASGTLLNVVREFWPDIRRLFRR
jgi:hypothetical protein